MTGIDELISPDGVLECHVPQGHIEVPAVRLDDDALVWDLWNIKKTYRPGPGLLEEFAELADAPNDTILMFAKRRGVLQLCEHDLPSSHNAAPSGGILWPQDPMAYCHERMRRRGGPFSTIKALTSAPIVCSEPIRVWRAFAREAGALVRLAAALHGGRQRAAADWHTIYARDPRVQAQLAGRSTPWWSHDRHRQNILMERMLIARKASDWIELGNVRLVSNWVGRVPGIQFAATMQGRMTLFGALALQLLFAISATPGLAICSACQASFTPRRQPRLNQRSYCDDCRASGAPSRDAKRDERRRAVETQTRTRPRRSVAARAALRHKG